MVPDMSLLTSTRFNPSEKDMLDADLRLVSSDGVHFYVHRNILVRHSSNHFGSLLPETNWGLEMELEMFQFLNTSELDVTTPAVIGMKYSAEVLSIVLHAIYQLSVQAYSPSPATLRAAIIALSQLGFDLNDIFSPESELFKLFVRAAEAEPLPMYAIAAHYSLESLAVSASAYTLDTPPSKISDELAVEMGAIYLKRLFREPVSFPQRLILVN